MIVAKLCPVIPARPRRTAPWRRALKALGATLALWLLAFCLARITLRAIALAAP